MVRDELSPQALLAEVELLGRVVTRDQLDRWVRRGFVPRPVTTSVGRRGKRSAFPSHAVNQVCALADLLQKDRRLDRAGFLLWWDGFDVKASAIRPFLLSVSDAWDEQANQVRALADGHSTDQGRDLTDLSDQLGGSRVRGGVMGRAARRVGRQDFPILLRVVGEVAAGRFDGFLDDGTDEVNEADVVAKGMALRPKAPTPYEPRTDEEIEADLVELAALMDGSARATVDGHSDAELEAAKQEASLVTRLFGALAHASVDLLPPELSAEREFARIVDAASPVDLAQMLIFWLRFRTVPALSEAIQDFVAACDAATHDESTSQSINRLDRMPP